MGRERVGEGEEGGGERECLEERGSVVLSRGFLGCFLVTLGSSREERSFSRPLFVFFFFLGGGSFEILNERGG